MDRFYFLDVAKKIAKGESPETSFFEKVLNLSDNEAYYLFPGADLLRKNFFGDEIHLCTIVNAKSGRCSEDCAFCAQSAHYKTDIPVYPLMDQKELIDRGQWASDTPINRYSLVTSGKALNKKDVDKVCSVFSKLKDKNIKLCASLGTLKKDDLKKLKQSGVDRYHHNLETSKSFFPNICTTHSYEERIETVKTAKSLGFSVCCGGILGLGEETHHILELAFTLKELSVDSIPLNFLTPIKGTPLENLEPLSPLKILKIISFFRYFFPEKEIIICGGRKNLKRAMPFIFMAGASGIMTGDYLTTKGFSLEEDLELLNHLGLKPRKK